MPIANWVLMLNLGATWFMVGLIWFVQVVHYPLFAEVGEEEYSNYQEWHQKLTTFVVGPPMLVEAFTTVLLAWYIPKQIPVWMILTGIALLFVIWISTAALQVPCHGKLTQGFDTDVHRRLVRTNWIRTIAWTLRGGLVAWMFANVTIGLGGG